jgi:hypothetical protein
MQGLRNSFANAMEKPELVPTSEISGEPSSSAGDRRPELRLRNSRQGFAFIIIATVAVLYPLHLGAKEDECTRTANMRVYSNAFLSEETGDLVGYELALKQAGDSTVEASLFVYEGAPDEGIRLPGRISGKNLTVEGNWLERQVEYPSKKEVVVTHAVEIDGTLDSDWFRGTIKIGGLVTPGRVRLKRVDRIWVCKK